MRRSRFDRALERVTAGVAVLSQETPGSSDVEEQADQASELQAALRELQDARDESNQQDEELTSSRRLIEEERERYRHLFQLAPDPYFVTDVRGVIREANLAGGELLGLGLESVEGKPLAEYSSPDERPAFFQALRSILRAGATDGYRLALRSRSGETRHVSVTARVFPGRARPREIWWLVRDVTARVERLRARGPSGDAPSARDAAVAQLADDDLLRVLSHELRTPITVILGNCEILSRHRGTIEQQDATDAFADIHAEAARMHRVIENLLTLLQFGRKGSAVSEATRLELVVEHAVTAHRRDCPWREVRLESAPRMPAVSARPDYMDQVMRNLLGNAEQRTPHGQPIDVRVTLEEGEVRIWVSDRGPGLPTHGTLGLFEHQPMEQESPATGGDTSIALAVSRRLIEAQGGRIWARSREGGGAELGIAMPVVIANTP